MSLRPQNVIFVSFENRCRLFRQTERIVYSSISLNLSKILIARRADNNALYLKVSNSCLLYLSNLVLVVGVGGWLY